MSSERAGLKNELSILVSPLSSLVPYQGSIIGAQEVKSTFTWVNFSVNFSSSSSFSVRYLQKTRGQSPRPTVHNLIFLKNFLSMIKYTYLRSGDFDFHRLKSFPNLKILKGKSVNWRFFQKHRASLHVLPSTILNIYGKFLQYNKICVSTIRRFQFSPTKVLSEFKNFESKNG